MSDTSIDIEVGDVLKQEYSHGAIYYYLVVDIDDTGNEFNEPLCKLQKFGESELIWDAIYNYGDLMKWSVIKGTSE
jgi:hypothetical protein